MAAMFAGIDVDFAWLLHVVMYERDIKVTTTYSFPCMVFEFFRSAGVPVWHIDVIKTPPGKVDIGLIRDEANELSSHKGPRPEVQTLGENLSSKKTQAANPTIS